MDAGGARVAHDRYTARCVSVPMDGGLSEVRARDIGRVASRLRRGSLLGVCRKSGRRAWSSHSCKCTFACASRFRGFASCASRLLLLRWMAPALKDAFGVACSASVVAAGVPSSLAATFGGRRETGLLSAFPGIVCSVGEGLRDAGGSEPASALLVVLRARRSTCFGAKLVVLLSPQLKRGVSPGAHTE